MKEPVARTAAIAATVGFAGPGLFQFLLAAGAPIGEAAWGGTNEGRLPMRLRVGSGIAIVIYGAVAVARSSPAGVVGAGKRSRPRRSVSTTGSPREGYQPSGGHGRQAGLPPHAHVPTSDQDSSCAHSPI